MTQALQSMNPFSAQQEEGFAAKLTLTDSAADKVWELIQEEGDLQLKLRVFITGGGCSGFQYGFTFDKLVNADDEVIVTEPSEDAPQSSGHEKGRRGRIALLVDPVSLGYLEGAEVDYKSDLSGERFIIRNPNAKTTCGCGSSFGV